MHARDAASRSPEAGDAAETMDAAMDPPDATSSDPDAAADSDASDRTDAAMPPLDAGPPAPVCPVGRYVGSFSCSLDPTGLTPLFVMTNVELGFAPAPMRPALVIASAPIAFDVTGVFFTGDLAGELDCLTGELRAEIVNGSFAPLLLPLVTPFTGSLKGKLERAIPRLAGSWEFSAFDGLICQGDWQATLQP